MTFISVRRQTFESASKFCRRIPLVASSTDNGCCDVGVGVGVGVGVVGDIVVGTATQSVGILFVLSFLCCCCCCCCFPLQPRMMIVVCCLLFVLFITTCFQQIIIIILLCLFFFRSASDGFMGPPSKKEIVGSRFDFLVPTLLIPTSRNQFRFRPSKAIFACVRSTVRNLVRDESYASSFQYNKIFVWSRNLVSRDSQSIVFVVDY